MTNQNPGQGGQQGGGSQKPGQQEQKPGQGGQPKGLPENSNLNIAEEDKKRSETGG